jgi:glycosyltransferase involved in cell wall biosynthesis
MKYLEVFSTKKFLSIITITKNDLGFPATLSSVQKQKLGNISIEHIIVDSLSKDNTPDIVAKYQKSAKYPVTYIREADTGRYQGMNKGIKAATGEYLLFLNASDTLHTDTLSKVFSTLHTADILYGDTMMVESPNKSEKWSLKDFSVNKKFFIERTLFHQSTFIKKELFDKYGLYDETLKIVGDFEFFIRTIIKHHATLEYLPMVISDYDTHGISSYMSDSFLAERASVIMRHYIGVDFIYHFLKYLYYNNKHLLPSTIVHLQQKRLAAKPKI